MLMSDRGMCVECGAGDWPGEKIETRTSLWKSICRSALKRCPSPAAIKAVESENKEEEFMACACCLWAGRLART